MSAHINIRLQARFIKHYLGVFLLFLAIASPCLAALDLPSIFSDGMVLQQNKAIAVWGMAEPGANVTVSFAGQKQTALSEKSGKFMVHLDAMKASGTPCVLTVSANEETVEVKNVLVGEVWLCAGQSNMRMSVGGVTNAMAEKAAANYPAIRFFTVPAIGHKEPQSLVNASWKVCSTQTVGSCTAVGYFFARKLHQDLKLPIGLIDISYGGATIATFMDAETVWHTLANAQIYKSDKSFLDKKPPFVQGVSSYCYNAMVHPIIPFTARGTIWYQGEGNAGAPAEYINWYRDYVLMMRRKFLDPAMPFYHVQLAGYEKPQPEVWARFRLAQEKALELPNTGMATAMDVGMKDNIHPVNKQDVGLRLALCALNKTYGKSDVVGEGPRFKSLRKNGSKIEVTFSGCDGGLKLNGRFGGFAGVLANGTTEILDGKIAGNDTVEIDLAGQDIKRLRYAYANYPVCPLFNGANLPALSFDQPVE